MIHENSRYINTDVIDDNNVSVLKLRTRLSFGLQNAKVHEFVAGDTLDGIAYKYYNNPHLWWVILEVNTKYKSIFDINCGDELIIPDYAEVMSCLNY